MDPAKAAEILALLTERKESMQLRAIIAKVSVDGREVLRTALGE